MTIRQALIEAAASLRSAGIESSSLDASLLLGSLMHRDRAGLLLIDNQDISPDLEAAFRALITRRLAGEPAAYILGHKEFRGLDFLVTPDVLIPQPDTETLIDALEAYEQEQTKAPLKVLDLCTGSGAIGIALKYEHPEWEIWASDISETALTVARNNAQRLLRRPCSSITLFRSDLFTALSDSPSLHSWDLIVSNPPYVPKGEIPNLPAEVRAEPGLALDGGLDGLDLIHRIIAEAPSHLPSGGALFLEADPHQIPAIKTLLTKAGFEHIQIKKDLSGQNRVIIGCIPLPVREGSGEG